MTEDGRGEGERPVAEAQEGAATPGGRSWSGAHQVTTKVRERRDKTDTCELRTTWDAAHGR